MSFLENFIRRLDEVTNKDSSSPPQTQTRRQPPAHQASPPPFFTAIAASSHPSPPISRSRPGPSILTDGRWKGLLKVANFARRWSSSEVTYRRQLMTFDMLPDDVLLKISDFYVNEGQRIMGRWIKLAHVCRRWRSVIFQSPRRLNLRLVCTPRTHAMDMVTLDTWPPLPLIIHDSYWNAHVKSSIDRIITALEHNNRVCQIQLENSVQLEKVTNSAAMQKPFPELTDLRLGMFGQESILLDSFLGQTTPRLRSLELSGVPFPGLPKLLLSATHLVHLDLFNITPSGYIPPEVMATSLSALTSLVFLRLRFRSPRPRPALESRRPPLPPLTRSILPNLTKFLFKGASEYLEEILSRIDAPRLNKMLITFFNQIIFDTPQLFQFITRRPTLRAPENGHIAFNSHAIIVRFLSQTPGYGVFGVRILCTAPEWQLSSLEQVCTSSLPSLSTLEDLYIFKCGGHPSRWQDDVENTLWLELLHPFAAVKNLYLSEEYVPRIAPALQELVGERTTEVLPTLKNIFLEKFRPSGPLNEGIETFVAARRLTSRPVAVSRWNMNPEQFAYYHYTY